MLNFLVQPLRSYRGFAQLLSALGEISLAQKAKNPPFAPKKKKKEVNIPFHAFVKKMSQNFGRDSDRPFQDWNREVDVRNILPFTMYMDGPLDPHNKLKALHLKGLSNWRSKPTIATFNLNR